MNIKNAGQDHGFYSATKSMILSRKHVLIMLLNTNLSSKQLFNIKNACFFYSALSAILNEIESI